MMTATRDPACPWCNPDVAMPGFCVCQLPAVVARVHDEGAIRIPPAPPTARPLLPRPVLGGWSARGVR